MPRWIVPTLVVLFTVMLIPAALITRARSTRSAMPRINLIPDMDYQPKYKPQSENALFADDRAMRPPIDGTVARGDLPDDPVVATGRDGDDWVATIPVPVTASLLERGRERFGIYCATCHGLAGDGDGMIHRRALQLSEQGLAVWVPPSSMHSDLVRDRPDGHIFNTITYGIRNMPSYGSQIEPHDRWAIVAYVRALQRSRTATLDDVPAAERTRLTNTAPAGADQP
jgi:mono/diheme cytochrome c family protein